MPYISQCTAVDLAGRSEPIELKLNRYVNVFFGPNGSGKTSLLRLFHSALSNDSKQLTKIPVSMASVTITEAPIDHSDWQIDEQQITREVDYQTRSLLVDRLAILGELDTSKKNIHKVWISRSDVEESDDSDREIEHVYLPITRLYATEDHRVPNSLRRGMASSTLSESDLDKVFVESINLLWLRYTRNLLSDIRSAQEDGLSSILHNVLTPEATGSEAPQVENPKLAYKRLISFLARQDSYLSAFYDEEDFLKRLDGSTLMRNVVADIERVEERVEKAQRPRNQFEKLIRQMMGANKTFELGDKDIGVEGSDGGRIGLGNLSSGEKQLVKICLEALFSGKNPIIIDEPELSMHIDWQRKLIRSLRLLSPDSQLIIATHSPEIMADLTEESIFGL